METTNLSCPIYNKNLDDMIKKKNYAFKDSDKLNILQEFAENFTLLPVQQIDLLKLSKQFDISLPEEMNNCLYSKNYGDKNLKHIEWSNYQEIINKLNAGTDPKRFKLAEEALSFPHKWVEKIAERYLFHSVKPITKEIELRNSNLCIYSNINTIAFKFCTDYYLNLIQNIKNKEAVAANLELKLGQSANWKIKKLWKFYFNFLKQNNMKEILEVFRKYTRLFICDKQAVRQYRKMIEKFSSPTEPQTKYWIDTIKYEMEFGKIEVGYRILEKAIAVVEGKTKLFIVVDKDDLCEKLKKFQGKMMKTEELQNSTKAKENQIEEKEISLKPAVYYQKPQQQQYFCFRRSFIQNLLKDADGTILRKLYSSCKFFFWLKKAPLCYRLEIHGNKITHYYKESLFLNEKDIDFAGLNNLHVFEMFVVLKTVNRNIASSILPKLKQCNIPYIIIERQNFTVLEFKFMLSKNIYQLLLTDVNIADKNGKHIDAKEFFYILKDYPSIKYLEFVNENSFIVASYCFHKNFIRKWRILDVRFSYETIYIAKQEGRATDLQNIIDYQQTKFITLKKVVVKDANEHIMTKEELKVFILSNVNPASNVSVNIF